MMLVKILKYLIVLVVILALVLLGVYTYLGGFQKIEPQDGSVGPLEMIYTVHVGPYQGLDQAWTEFQKTWQEAGLVECDSMSVYLDSPEVSPQKYRTLLGCRLDSLNSKQQNDLKAKFPSVQLPKMSAVTAKFPFKNRLSFMLGAMKVYPELHKSLAANGKKSDLAIEIYGPMSIIKNIHYYLPESLDKSKFEMMVEKNQKQK